MAKVRKYNDGEWGKSSKVHLIKREIIYDYFSYGEIFSHKFWKKSRSCRRQPVLLPESRLLSKAKLKSFGRFLFSATHHDAVLCAVLERPGCSANIKWFNCFRKKRAYTPRQKARQRTRQRKWGKMRWYLKFIRTERRQLKTYNRFLLLLKRRGWQERIHFRMVLVPGQGVAPDDPDFCFNFVFMRQRKAFFFAYSTTFPASPSIADIE